MPAKWTGDVVAALHINGITQADLAAKMGVTVPYISMLLNGKKSATGAKDRMMEAIREIKADPYVAYDLMRDSEWVDAHKYAQPTNLYTGEIGEIAGVRFVESTEAKVWNDSNCPQIGSSGKYYSVFATLFLGKNAYGVTEVTGGGLQTIVKAKGSGGTSDPLDQRSTVGWKGIRTAKILLEQNMVRVESISAEWSESTAAN